ncbi:hypothetical protein [Azospirillum palustre]
MPERFKIALLWLMTRRGGASPGLIEQAKCLLSVARHWVQAPKADLDRLNKLVAKLGNRHKGMTDKNRARLRAFDDPKHLLALLTLPERLMDKAERVAAPSRREALMAQTAVAVQILLLVPLRRLNLLLLDVHRHLCRSRSGRHAVVHLVIPAEETKTSQPIEAVPGGDRHGDAVAHRQPHPGPPGLHLPLRRHRSPGGRRQRDRRGHHQHGSQRCGVARLTGHAGSTVFASFSAAAGTLGFRGRPYRWTATSATSLRATRRSSTKRSTDRIDDAMGTSRQSDSVYCSASVASRRRSLSSTLVHKVCRSAHQAGAPAGTRMSVWWTPAFGREVHDRRHRVLPLRRPCLPQVGADGQTDPSLVSGRCDDGAEPSTGLISRRGSGLRAGATGEHALFDAKVSQVRHGIGTSPPSSIRQLALAGPGDIAARRNA